MSSSPAQRKADLDVLIADARVEVNKAIEELEQEFAAELQSSLDRLAALGRVYQICPFSKAEFDARVDAERQQFKRLIDGMKAGMDAMEAKMRQDLAYFEERVVVNGEEAVGRWLFRVANAYTLRDFVPEEFRSSMP